MGVMQKIKNGLYRFMYGRNGMDQLNRMLFWVYLVVFLMQTIVATLLRSGLLARVCGVLLWVLVLLIFFAALIELNAAALSCNLKSCNGFQKLLLAISGNSRYTKDFSAENIEAYIVQHLDFLTVINSQMGNGKAFHRIYRRRACNIQFHLLANHHLCKGIFCSFTGLYCAYVLPFSKDCHAVRNLQNFVKLVGNDDNRFVICFHVSDHFKKSRRFLRSQNCRRLIQDQNVCTSVKNV